MALFECVGRILAGKTVNVERTHDFVFRRLFTCKVCSMKLIGETHKGHVYYRCQTRGCPTTTVREEMIEEKVKETLSALNRTDDELADLHEAVAQLRTSWKREREEGMQTVERTLGQIAERLDRLTDAYVDRLIEKDVFNERREKLLIEKRVLEERRGALLSPDGTIPDRIHEFLERSKSTYTMYLSGTTDHKRALLAEVTSNRFVEQKNVAVELRFPFSALANWGELSKCDPYRGTPRTFEDGLLQQLIAHFQDARFCT